MTLTGATLSTDEDTNSSVDELETALKADPANDSLKEDLADALLRRCLSGAEESDDKHDLKRLRTVLKDLSESAGTLPRAYISYRAKRYEEAADWLAVYAEQWAEKGDDLTFDDVFYVFVDPFCDAKPIFWKKLVAAFEKTFPDSAAAHYLTALASSDSDEIALHCMVALEKDPAYWDAAFRLGDIHSIEKNWQSASVFYKKALQSTFGQASPLMHFEYGDCLYQLMKYQEAEVQFRKCLELNDEWENVRNSLGLALFQQKRYEEALLVFDEAIKLGLDGPYPLRNRAYALKKLKRYPEAIQAFKDRANWRGGNPDGRLPAWLETEIGRINKLMAASSDGETNQIVVSASLELEPDPDDDEIEQVVADAPALKPAVSMMAVPKERLIEQAIEQLIKQGKTVFGLQLKMYQSPDGRNGRQFNTRIGQIDLLVEDIQTGDLIVMELKKGKGHEAVVGQIANYMTWVRENLAKENQRVRGLICVQTADEKLKSAARSIPGVDVFEYGFSFNKVTL